MQDSEETIVRITWDGLAAMRNPDGEPLVVSLSALFLETATERLDTIEASLNQGSADQCAQEAHRLKSAAANLGAGRLSRLCAAIEALAKTQVEPQMVSEIIIQVRNELESVKKRLTALIGELDHSPVEANTHSSPSPLVLPKTSDKPEILIVDDDPFYRAILVRTISQVVPHARITTTESYAGAVEFIQSTPLALVVADLNLNSTLSGMDVWHEVRRLQPEAMFLLISGTSLDDFLSLIGNSFEDAPTYLPKPFRLDQCRDLIAWLVKKSMIEAA